MFRKYFRSKSTPGNLNIWRHHQYLQNHNLNGRSDSSGWGGGGSHYNDWISEVWKAVKGVWHCARIYCQYKEDGSLSPRAYSLPGGKGLSIHRKTEYKIIEIMHGFSIQTLDRPERIQRRRNEGYVMTKNTQEHWDILSRWGFNIKKFANSQPRGQNFTSMTPVKAYILDANEKKQNRHVPDSFTKLGEFICNDNCVMSHLSII